MINKIKDFLKNRLKRNRAEDSSDQDIPEFYDVELPEDDTHPQEEPVALSENEDAPPFHEETEEDAIDLPPLENTRPSFKERLTQTLQIKLPELKKKKSEWKKPSVSFSEKFQWKKPSFSLPRSTKAGTQLSPNISKLSEQFLSRQSRESIHQVSLVLIICGITYSLGKLTALALKGKGVEGPRRVDVAISMEDEFNPRDLQMVRTINPFRTDASPTKKIVADAKCEKPQQKSNLPIKLVNTIVLQDSVKSLASVQVRGGRDVKEVREGDQIDNMAKIFKIDRLELLVRNLESGVCESISSDKLNQGRPSPIAVMTPGQKRNFLANRQMPGIENKGNRFSIQKTLLDEKLKDIGNILTQARAVKIQNPDGSMSFKMTEMDPEGIFPYLGLQEGDIITSINGKPIFDLNEVMSLFGRIKNIENLQLGIKREGSESVQDYQIK